MDELQTLKTQLAVIDEKITGLLDLKTDKRHARALIDAAQRDAQAAVDAASARRDAVGVAAALGEAAADDLAAATAALADAQKALARSAKGKTEADDLARAEAEIDRRVQDLQTSAAPIYRRLDEMRHAKISEHRDAVFRHYEAACAALIDSVYAVAHLDELHRVHGLPASYFASEAGHVRFPTFGGAPRYFDAKKHEEHLAKARQAAVTVANL